ncbi:MAG: hypothetical protein LBJ97_02690 [Mycoplasmataceae bacterium]|nr:hypothetical protein [Mycoplasmataceae bacterium]
MKIDGNGGTLFNDMEYIYSLSWRGIYDSNIVLNKFRVDYYDDNNGKAGKLDSTYSQYFTDWHEINNNNTIEKEHKFVIRTNDNEVLPTVPFWIQISYSLDRIEEAISLKQLKPYLGSISLDMDVNDKSDPSLFCTPLTPEKDMDGYSVLLNDELGNQEGYIFDDPTLEQSKLVYNRWNSDVIYEVKDAVQLIKNAISIPITIKSDWTGHIEFDYDLKGGIVTNFKLNLDANIVAFGIWNVKVNINIATHDEYVINGAFSFHPWENQYYQKCNGNYLSLAPVNTGGIGQLGSYYECKITTNSSLLNFNVDQVKFCDGVNITGSSDENIGLYVKSYYLSDFEQIEKVKIKEFSYDPKYYAGHSEYIPTITQPNRTIDDIPYNEYLQFQNNAFTYYHYSDQTPTLNISEAYLDDSEIVRNNLGNPYELTMMYGDGYLKEKSIPWYYGISYGRADMVGFHNDLITDWNERPFLFWNLNYVYSPIEGPDNPRTLPDPWDSTKEYEPRFFFYAFPPDVIKFVEAS